MKAMVLGSGGWGTALALLLRDNGHAVSLWSHNPEKAEAMRKTRENPLLAGVPLPEELNIVSDIALVAEADLVVFATPSFALRETARKAAPYLRPEQTLVSVTKGIERDTNLRMSEVLRQETGDICKVVSLSGPSHAEEVGRRLPTGCVAACPDEKSAKVTPLERASSGLHQPGYRRCGALRRSEEHHRPGLRHQRRHGAIRTNTRPSSRPGHGVSWPAWERSWAATA